MKYGIMLLLVYMFGIQVYAERRHSITVIVSNDTNIERMEETVELRLDKVLKHLKAKENLPLAVFGKDGKEIPSQRTYDGKLLFQVKLGANESATFDITQVQPTETDTLVRGAFYPQRKDDLAWENDKGAYRAYGPTLQRIGEKSYGYDIWTKSVERNVVAQRYYDNAHGKSFHKDHGDGMDVYGVGPTLGGGTSALLVDGKILYPYCFKEHEILDNGPIRFTARLVYHPVDVKGKQVVETRIISLDKGSWLNRTTVAYEGLDSDVKVVTGIVLHQENPYGYHYNVTNGYMHYADLTQNANAGNGVIYVGAVFPNEVSAMRSDYFEEEEWKTRSAVGHLIAETDYAPASEYIYYWGGAWSKGGCPSAMVWEKYLKSFKRQLDNPLQVIWE